MSPYNGKIKVSARKIANLFGEHSGVSIRILEVVNNRKWKSSWLFLEPEKHSMWFLSFCSSGRVQICDSLKSKLNRLSMKSLYPLNKHVGEFEKVKPTFLPVHKQTDGFNYGPFAIAYAAEILHGKSPMEAIFDVKKMRNHLLVCLEQKTLTPFPKINKI